MDHRVDAQVMRVGAGCRSCGAASLHPVLSLGETPLANSLLSADRLDGPEARYPLDVVLCTTCSLVQLTLSVPPDTLFSDYVYFSSFSDTVVANARALVERVVRAGIVGPAGLAAEIASNDGYLLQFYRAAGVPVLGIEPAANIAAVARERGIETVVDFFGLDLARRLRRHGRTAQVLHANNVLAHVPDLNGFVEGVRTVLAPRGIAIVEVPYVKDLVDHVEFDTIYHEHLCYFSLTALRVLFARHALAVLDVERIPIHGGSLRVTVGVEGAEPLRAEGAEAVASLAAEERQWGAANPAFYDAFAGRVERLKASLLDLLRRLEAEGSRVAAYGAAAKGATLLNCFGIGRELVEFVADRSSIKQGRFMPGVRLPIVSPARLVDERPDYTLLLAWNFENEILEQQAEYRARGGRFIIPIPEIRIV